MSTTETAPSTKMITGTVRLSYANVWKATAIGDSEEKKFNTTILIDKTDKATLDAIAVAVEAAKELGKTKWGGKIPKNLKLPLRDGDIDKPESDEYAGMMFLSASGKQKPGIVDRNRKEITDESEVYSGCYCRLSLNFYAFDVKGNKGVGVGLNNIMKIKDGEAFSGRASAESDFADIEVEDDDNFL